MVKGFRILGIDWGKRRLGLAVCDELGITVRGLPTLVRTQREADLQALEAIAQAERIGLLVVGRPLTLDGAKGKSAVLAEQFGRTLASRLNLEVAFHDERLTSREAESRLRDSGRTPTKGEIDRVSAELILESYLSSAPQENPA